MALKPLLLCILLSGLWGCGSIQPVENEAAGFAPWSSAAPPYHLGVGDRLRVDFLMTPEMSQDVTVEPDGFISLRAGGRIPAQGVTPDQLESLVRQAASNRLRNPVVTLAVTEAKAARIIVGGAVARPGVYPLPARPSPLEAVMLAGGFSPESRVDQVVIIRQRDGAAPMLRTVDLRRFLSGDGASNAILLASEDIVFVPRSRVAEVNLWIDQHIDRMLPFNRSVSITNVTEGLR